MVKDKSDSRRLQLLSFSPWILGSACILLLLLLAFFAIANYDREKQLITRAVEQKGLTLVRFISSAVGDSIRSSMRRTGSYETWEVYMQPALELAIEQPGVEFISIVDGHGNILLSAGDNNSIDNSNSIKNLIDDLHSKDQRILRTRIFTSEKDGTEKVLIATRYIGAGQHFRRQNNRRGFQGERGVKRFSYFQSFKNDMERVEGLAPIYLLQLDFSEFTAPLQRQFVQIVLELLAILLVGLGGTLSFFTLRNLKGSEKQLGKMRGFNDALVSSLPIGIIATGDNGTLQVINDAAEKITGVKGVVGGLPEDSLPLPVAHFFSELKNHSASESGRVTHSGEVSYGERSLEVTVFSVESTASEFVGEVMLLKDVTEVKNLEKELHRSERLAVVGKMAAGVAHELRNPLSSIKGLALLLQAKVAGSAQDEQTAETFVTEVERLNRSIGELLDYAKPSKLDIEPCSIESVLEKTLSLIGPDLDSYQVNVTRHVADNLPKVLIDKDKMSQVILNVFLNALQAMEDVDRVRELKVTIERDRDYQVLTICDNGTGIMEENIRKIFDPYFTTKSNGVGLGLALSLKTVEEHGGTLTVRSTYGSGTEFTILLRRCESSRV
ncbi:ATP-binding protein [Desulforhopalus sp. 52FAK]